MHHEKICSDKNNLDRDTKDHRELFPLSVLSSHPNIDYAIELKIVALTK